MPTEVGSAYVTILPSMRGFSGAMQREMSGAGAAAGAAGGKKWGKGFAASALPSLKGLGAGLAVLGIGAVIKDSVQLEAEFSQTMNTMAAVANVPQAQIKELSALALKMGADTSFSANEASEAMLELAKGGLSAADIQGGALAGTLTLAAAGGTDLATASTIASNALNVFGLKGKDMAAVSAALAGGANASSASVESLGEALGQVGPGAKNAGLSLQETIGALSAFDAAGIKGSDAGTSLKTMLTRLVPMTDKAAGEMKRLGLDFTDASGAFVPITNVAEQLRAKLSKLSEEERTAALATMFGSDATRAATVLMEQGAAGLGKYIAAANDKNAAERVAAARTSGTAGALERLSGSIETAKLGLGRLFAPAVVAGADAIGKATNTLAGGLDSLMSGGGGGAPAWLSSLGQAAKTFGAAMLPTLQEIGGKLASVLGPALRDIGQMITGQLIPAFTRFLPAITPVAKFLLSVLGGAVVGVLRGAVNVIKGVLNVVIGVFRTFSALLTGDWRGAWDGIKQIVSGILRALLGAFQIWWNGGILAIFKKGALFLTKGIWVGMWNGLKGIGSSAMGALKGLIGKGFALIGNVIRAYGRAYLAILRGAWNLIRGAVSSGISAARSVVTAGLGAIRSAFARAWAGITGAVSSAWAGIKSAVSGGIEGMIGFVREIPGRILSALGDLGGLLYDAGKNMMMGMLRGIKDMAGQIASEAKNAVTGAASAAWDAISPGSPSRTFRPMGRNMGEGISAGLLDMRRDAALAARSLTAAAASGVAGQTVSAGSATVGPIRVPRVKLDAGAMRGGDGAAAPVVQVFIDGREIESAVVRVSDRRDAAMTNSLAYRGSM